MSEYWKLFLIIFIPSLVLFVGGFFVAAYVAGWLGVVLVMLSMASMCLSGYWVPVVMRRLK